MSERDYIKEHATQIVDDVLDGWDFVAWTAKQREQMLDELATAVIEAAPAIAHELAKRQTATPAPTPDGPE